MKKIAIAIVLVMALAISAFGFAAWTQDLTLNGSVAAQGNWDVHFASGDLNDDYQGISTEPAPSIELANDNTTATIKDLTLLYPGAGASFTIVVENSSSVTAKVSVEETVPFKASYLSFSSVALTNDEIAPGESCTFVVTVKWNADDDSNHEEALIDEFSYTLTYEPVTTEYTGTPSHNAGDHA